MSSPMEKAYAKYQAANLAAQKVAIQTGQTQEIKSNTDQLGNTNISYAPSTPNPVASAPTPTNTNTQEPTRRGPNINPFMPSLPQAAPTVPPILQEPQMQTPPKKAEPSIQKGGGYKDNNPFGASKFASNDPNAGWNAAIAAALNPKKGGAIATVGGNGGGAPYLPSESLFKPGYHYKRNENGDIVGLDFNQDEANNYSTLLSVPLKAQPKPASNDTGGESKGDKSGVAIFGLTVEGGPTPGTADYYRAQFGLSGNKNTVGAKNNASATSDLVVTTPAKIPNYDPFVRDEKGNAVGTFDSAGNVTGVQIKPGFKGQVVKGEEEGEFYYKATPEEQELYYPKQRSYALTPSQETNLKYEAVQNISKRGGSLTQDAINQEVGNLLDTKYAVKTPTGETGFAVTGGSTISPKDMGTLYAGFKANQVVEAGNKGESSAYSLTAEDKQALRDNIAEQAKRGEISKEEANTQISALKNLNNLGATVNAQNIANQKIVEQNDQNRRQYEKKIADEIREGQTLGYDVKANTKKDSEGNLTTELVYAPKLGATQYTRLEYDTLTNKKGDLFPISKTDANGNTTPIGDTRTVAEKYGTTNPAGLGGLGEFIVGSGTFGRTVVEGAAGIFGIKNPLGSLDKSLTGGKEVKPQYSAVDEAQKNLSTGKGVYRGLGAAHGRYVPELTPEKSAAILTEAAETNPARLAGESFALGGISIGTGEGVGKAASTAGKIGSKVFKLAKGGVQRAYGETAEDAAASAGKKIDVEAVAPTTKTIDLVGENGGASRFSSVGDVFSKQTVSDIADSLKFKNASLGVKAVKTKFVGNGVSTEVAAAEEPTAFRTGGSTEDITTSEPAPSPTSESNTIPKSPSGSSGSSTIATPSAEPTTPTIKPAPQEGITPPEEFLGNKFTPPEELPTGFRPAETERLRIAQEAKNARSSKLKAQEQLDLVHSLLQQGKNTVGKAKTSAQIGRARASMLRESAVGKVQSGVEGLQTRTQALSERQSVLKGLQDITKPKSPFKQEAAGSPTNLMGGKIPKVNRPRPINEDRFVRENIDRELGKDLGYSKSSIIQVQREVPKPVKYTNKVKARQLKEEESKTISLLGEEKGSTKEGNESKGSKKKKEFSAFLSVESAEAESFISPPGYVQPSLSGTRGSSRIGLSVDNIIDLKPKTRSSPSQPPAVPGAGNNGLERLTNPSKPRSSGSERLDIVPRQGGGSGFGTIPKTNVNVISVPTRGTGLKEKPSTNVDVGLDVGQGTIRMPTPKPPTPPSEKIKIPKLPPIPKLDLPGGGAFSSGSKGSGKSGTKQREVRNIFLEGFDIAAEGEGTSFNTGSRPRGKGKGKKDDLLSLF